MNHQVGRKSLVDVTENIYIRRFLPPDYDSDNDSTKMTEFEQKNRNLISKCETKMWFMTPRTDGLVVQF